MQYVKQLYACMYMYMHVCNLFVSRGQYARLKDLGSERRIVAASVHQHSQKLTGAVWLGLRGPGFRGLMGCGVWDALIERVCAFGTKSGLGPT